MIPGRKKMAIWSQHLSMHNKIKNAVLITQRAQRNYDLSKTVPQDHLDTLIYAAANSPSKQNETHYSLHVYTDQDIVRKIYNHTKKFTLVKETSDSENLYGIDKEGKFWQDDTRSVKNSQILANILFVYVKEKGQARGMTHKAGQESKNTQAEILYTEQANYSIGISVGELILSAALLGYTSGICSALDTDPIRDIIGVEQDPTLLVGIGIANTHLARTQHAEVLNKDVPDKFRTGNENDNWHFPSFNKDTRVTINGVDTSTT